MVGNPLLEIGPGSGHFLAAAKGWAMYRVPDHVSIHQSASSRWGQAGMIPVRIWSLEYPLETPGSIAVGTKRDLWTSNTSHGPNRTVGNGVEPEPAVLSIRRIGQRLMKSAIFSPVAKTISAFGAGGSIKVLYQKSKS